MSKTKPSPAPAPTKLSGAALRKLRALGHALDPIVAIGKDGLTDAIVRAMDAALATHELVKVKVHREAPVDRHAAAIDLAARTGSVLAQVIGRTLLLYRRHPKKPKIVLPLPGQAKTGKTGKSAKGAKSAPSANALSKAPAEAEDNLGDADDDLGDN